MTPARRTVSKKYHISLAPTFAEAAEQTHLSASHNRSLALLILKLTYLADDFPPVQPGDDIRMIELHDTILLADKTEIAPLAVFYRLIADSSTVMVVDVKPLESGAVQVAASDFVNLFVDLLDKVPDKSVEQVVKLLAA